MSVYERLREEIRDAKAKKNAGSPRTSSADWENHKTRGRRIGEYYRQKYAERLYERTYLDDNTT